MEQLVLLVSKGRDLHIRRRGLKLLYGSLLGQYSEQARLIAIFIFCSYFQLADIVLKSHIGDLVEALRPYVDRYHVLSSAEIAMASKFIRLFREVTSEMSFNFLQYNYSISNQVRVDVDKTMALISAVIPACLPLLQTAGSSTPLRHEKKCSYIFLLLFSDLFLGIIVSCVTRCI